MQEPSGEATWELDAQGLTVVRIPSRRQQPTADQVLRRLVSRVAAVPTDDVELSWRCPECGARHGTPTIGYPVRGSGVAWFADATAGGGSVFAGVGSRHPFAFAVVTEPPPGRVVDEISFASGEIDRLDGLGDETRAAERAAMWARKAALARVLRHRTFLEPARVELTGVGDDGTVRLARGVPEFGTSWTGVEIRDLPIAGPFAAALAVLPTA